MSSLSRFSSSSSSSKSSSSKSSSSKSGGGKDEESVIFSDPFPTAIKSCAGLQYILDVRLDYDIYLDNSELHWYLLVHCSEGDKFPYISLEITSNALWFGKMVPTMRIIQPDKMFESSHVINAYLGKTAVPIDAASVGLAGASFVIKALLLHLREGGVREVMLSFGGIKATKIHTRKTTLMELCKTAERVRLGMGDYNLLTNNCQHFCNNVLKELGLPTKQTTVGPTTTTVKDIDNIDAVFTVK